MTSIFQRAELQAQIWKIANDVHGSVAGLRADINAIVAEIEGEV